MIDTLPKDAVILRVNAGQPCEAGLFDPSFACTDCETERCQVTNTVVWLCSTHKHVITIQPSVDE